MSKLVVLIIVPLSSLLVGVKTSISSEFTSSISFLSRETEQQFVQSSFLPLNTNSEAIKFPNNEIVFNFLSSSLSKSMRVDPVPMLNVCGLAVWHQDGNNQSHILVAKGGENWANIRIDGQDFQLGYTPGLLDRNNSRTQPLSQNTFQTIDSSVIATLEGNWEPWNEYSQGIWKFTDGTLSVRKNDEVIELPVSASLGCQWLRY